MMMVKEIELINKFRDMNLAVKETQKSMFVGMLKISNDFLKMLNENTNFCKETWKGNEKENLFTKDLTESFIFKNEFVYLITRSLES